ncbi:hypothetical protein, partial [Streptomyces sp. MBT56]|uniref:hypothetical protein n=1 Tax=Streptomyces sp. MBT56 TaxID=1488387 RepID=UPI0027DCAD10
MTGKAPFGALSPDGAAWSSLSPDPQAAAPNSSRADAATAVSRVRWIMRNMTDSFGASAFAGDGAGG